MNVRTQFMENAAREIARDKDKVIKAALQAYSPQGFIAVMMDELTCVVTPDGDERYYINGDPLIRIEPATFSWQQKPETTLFNVTQKYELLFDIEEQP